MRFYGFSPRAVLVRDYLGAKPEDVVLEIGPGSGNTARAVIGRTAGYWGVDASAEAVRGLEGIYGGRADVVLTVADACGQDFLGRTFDKIFSIDTLEHVADALAFFRFAARHLAPGGTMLVCFPNGMGEKKGRAYPLRKGGEAGRHGITWFETREDLEGAVLSAGFGIEELLEVRDSAWQNSVRTMLWDGPRTVALGMLRVMRALRKGRSPEEKATSAVSDTYEGTESFRINKRGGLVRDAAAFWARFSEGVARIFPPFRVCPAGERILGRRILVRLRKTPFEKKLTPPPVRSIL